MPRTPLLAAVAALSLTLGAAHAQMFKDSAFEALYQADRNDELQRAATQRLAAQPDDAQAVLALAVTALARDDAAARRQALARAEACAERAPQAAACRYAHGVVLGVQAMSEGMLKAARSAGTVREALQAAYEIEPAWYPARSAFMEFHLEAPGFMGGSRSKAEELAKTAPRPEQVAALQARIQLHDKKPEPALSALMALPANLEPTLAADARAWGVQAGLQLVNAGQSAKTLPFFERAMRDKPTDPGALYGMARAKGELGDWAEALKLLERAQGLNGAEAWPIGHRIGIAQQQLGRNDAAKVSFKRFVDAGKGPKASLDDARKRLEQLGG